MRSKSTKGAVAARPDELFDRVVRILEQARGNVNRSVNTNMVLAYWLIGREIVLAVQGGRGRAEYGQQVLDQLSRRLTQRYGGGLLVTNLKYFRLFFQAYEDRVRVIRHPAGDELGEVDDHVGSSSRLPIRHPAGGELAKRFSPQLSWSHYRALMRVDDVEARLCYEREAAECSWSKSQLERQIHSFYYQRIIANRGKAGLAPAGRKRLTGEVTSAGSFLKSPYVLTGVSADGRAIAPAA